MLRYRRQNGVLSADVVDERTDGSLAPEIDSLIAMSGSGVVGGDCVG